MVASRAGFRVLHPIMAIEFQHCLAIYFVAAGLHDPVCDCFSCYLVISYNYLSICLPLCGL